MRDRPPDAVLTLSVLRMVTRRHERMKCREATAAAAAAAAVDATAGVPALKKTGVIVADVVPGSLDATVLPPRAGAAGASGAARTRYLRCRAGRRRRLATSTPFSSRLCRPRVPRTNSSRSTLATWTL